MAKQMEITCVGMRHRVTLPTLREMQKLSPLKIRFRREPQNLHDENAIQVVVDEKPWKGLHVGFIPRQTASELAPRIDDGEIELLDGLLISIDDEAGTGEMAVNFKRPSKASHRAKN